MLSLRVAIKDLHSMAGMLRNSLHASKGQIICMVQGREGYCLGGWWVVVDWLYVEVSSTGVRDLQLEGRRPTRSYGRGVASNEAMTIGEYRPESISINSFIIGQAQLGPRVGYSYWLVTGYWPRLWRNCFRIKYKFICIFIWP